MIDRTEQDGFLHLEFGTLAEYAHFADAEATSGRNTSESKAPSMPESVKLACEGWPEGAERSAKVATRLGDVAAGRVLQHDPFFDVTGLEIDVGAFTAGQPECWIDVAPSYVPADGQVVTLCLSVAVSWSVTTEQLIARGVTIAAAVAALEAAGRSVEVWARLAVGPYGSGNSGGKPAAMASVCVKRAGQPLNLSEVAFACAHPAMLRRLGFGFLDYASGKRGVKGVSQSACYGSPIDPPKEYCGDVTAPAIRSGHTPTEAEMLKWVEEALKKQGIETAHVA